MISPREWTAIFDRLDAESEGHSVNPDVKPISYEIDEIAALRARVANLEVELETQRQAGGGLMRFLQAAETRGFVIQLIPGRFYVAPKEAD